MIDVFRADLLRLISIFYQGAKTCAGYAKSRLDEAENRLGVMIPETLRVVYETIAGDEILAKDFYPPEGLILVKEPRRYYGKFLPPIHAEEIERFLAITLTEEQKHSEEPLIFSGIIGEHTGIEFLDSGWEKHAYFPDCRRDSDYAIFEKISAKCKEERYFGLGGEGRNYQYPPFSDFLELFANSAMENMPHMATFAGTKLSNDYFTIAEKLGFCRFESYIPLTSPHHKTDVLYSELWKAILLYDDIETPKLVIASNNLDALEEIGKEIKLRWLRKNGTKIIDPKYFCNETIPERFEEQLEMIYNIYYGTNLKPIDADKIAKAEQKAGISLPAELRLFYQFYGVKQTLLEARYTIPKLRELTFENGWIPFAIEEQGVCEYRIKADTGEVFYVNNHTYEKVNGSLAGFLLQILAQQGTGFMCAMGLLSKESEYRKFFRELPAGDGSIYVNQKRKLLGMDYGTNEILVMSHKQESLYKLYEQCGLMLSEL